MNCAVMRKEHHPTQNAVLIFSNIKLIEILCVIACNIYKMPRTKKPFRGPRDISVVVHVIKSEATSSIPDTLSMSTIQVGTTFGYHKKNVV